MSAADVRQTAASGYAHLFIPILLLFVLFGVAVLRSPNLVSSAGIGSAVIVAAPLILASYALTFIVMAGRGGVDLSIGPLIGFINVTLVQLFAAKYLESPFGFFAYAFAVGIAYQLLMGLIIVYVRIQPIIVALSGYLTLAGLNLMILPRPGGLAPEWMGPWGLGETIWSPVLAILIVATGAWFVFSRTAFYDHLRLMGSDERTAYASGVNITIVRLGAHVIAGVYAGLAALTFTSLISSGDPTQGSTYTLMTVTALVLGGTSLAGGRGSIVGSLLGALNIYLITYVLATFSFGKIQSFVTQLSYGLILVAALLLTIFLPQVQRLTRALSPVAVFALLALVAFGVVLYAKDSARVARLAQSSATVGQSLAGQSLSAQSLSAQSLAGQSLTGQSLSATAQAEQQQPAGTPVVIAVVIIAAIVFLVVLLYRYLNLYSLAFVGALVLLLIGYVSHDGSTLANLAVQAPSAHAAAPPSFFYLNAPLALVAGSGQSLFASSLVSTVAFLVGALLLGTVLIRTTVPQAGGRVGEVSLWFIATAFAIAAIFVVYENNVLGLRSSGTFSGALGPVLVGAILFIVTLPAFQRRIRNITAVMIALLSVAGLVAAFFATVPAAIEPGSAAATVATGPLGQPPAPIALPATSFELPALFYVETFAILVAAAVIFLLTIAGVRHHVLPNLKFDPKAESFSYTGIFIAITATLALGSIFVIAGIPIWKFFVAIIASVIGARFLFHFLQDYRRRGGSGGGVGLGRDVRA